MLQSSASTIRYPLLSLREQKGDGDIPDFPEYNISFYSTSNGLKNLLLSKIMAKSKCLPLPHICHNLEWPSAKGCSCGIPFLVVCFQTAFARTPPEITFLIVWVAANGVHRNSLAKFGIFLAHLSTALKKRPDEKR